MSDFKEAQRASNELEPASLCSCIHPQLNLDRLSTYRQIAPPATW